jgi:hypothetical protein
VKPLAHHHRASGTVARPPGQILDIVESGGVLPRLAAQGFLPTEVACSPSWPAPC